MTIPSVQNLIINFSATKWFTYCLLACVAVVGALYIWQVNMSATQGYAVRDMESDITLIEHENEQLQNQVSSLRSIDSVMTRVQMLGLVKVDDVVYLNSDDSMAVNR
ncbi:hypothetical protein HN358_00390 [Candidatus Uhrbacteria bacterium]|jgi:cell division protein FtsL|nr:hypothetical protein [Candidatus Uhrbacteria bacterium]MBT7717700.1 hypothetical protein [Candidatus Uhrbacteria bacterium]